MAWSSVVVLRESLPVVLGGTVLFGAGIVPERRGTSPVDSGRHLVEVVRERFS